MGKGSLSKCTFLNMNDSFLLSISLKPLVKGEYCLVFFFLQYHLKEVFIFMFILPTTSETFFPSDNPEKDLMLQLYSNCADVHGTFVPRILQS